MSTSSSCEDSDAYSTKHISTYRLPISLLETVLNKFDKLAANGLISFDGPVATNVYTTSGFCLELRVSPGFRMKPALAASAALSSANPFLNPDRRMIVIENLGSEAAGYSVRKTTNYNKVYVSEASGSSLTPASFTSLGPPSIEELEQGSVNDGERSVPAAKYRLMMNKFCVYRPQLLITTREFASQADDLDADDLEACWAVMMTLGEGERRKCKTATKRTDSVNGDEAKGPRRYMMIYNAGRSSGNSQPHKHMQVFPEPRQSEHTFYFDPANPSVRRVGNRGGINLWSATNVPFWYVSALLPSSLQGASYEKSEDSNGNTNSDRPSTKATSPRDTLWHIFAQLLAEINDELSRVGVPGPASYNVIMTQDVMALIPRRMPGRDGLMVNAPGMAGLVWLSYQLDLSRWTPPRLEAHLENCGLPRRAPGLWCEE